jgi:hypothetical protein
MKHTILTISNNTMRDKNVSAKQVAYKPYFFATKREDIKRLDVDFRKCFVVASKNLKKESQDYHRRAKQTNDSITKDALLQSALICDNNNSPAILDYASFLQSKGYTDEALRTYRRWKTIRGIKSTYHPPKVEQLVFNSNSGVIKFLGKVKALKYLMSWLILCFGVMPHTANAQVDSTAVPLDQIYNQFQKPDVHSQYLGKKEFEYYGSGDVNNNGIPGELEDAQAIRDSVINDMGDVNADGKVDSLDIKMIEDYASGIDKLIGIDYMNPEFTKEEKEKWILDLYNNVYIPSFGEKTILYEGGDLDISIPGYDCSNYTEQPIHDFQGWTDTKAFIDKHWSAEPRSNFVYGSNARFNIQCAEGGQSTSSNGSHAVIRFPVGEDLTLEENWLSVDGRTGDKAGKGTNYMTETPGKVITTDWAGVSQKWGPIRGPPIIKFKVTEDGSFVKSWSNPGYNFQRPTTGISKNKEVSADEKSIDLKMQNPITNSNPYMNFETKNPGETRLEVFDTQGKKLEEKVFNTSYGENQKEFNFSNLTSGMYIFKATDSKGNVDVERGIVY